MSDSGTHPTLAEGSRRHSAVMNLVTIFVSLVFHLVAEIAAESVQFPSRTPPLYYGDSFPYCALMRLTVGATTTFQVDTQGRSYFNGVVMMAARTYNITTDRPYAADGKCSTYVGDDGTLLPFVSMSSQTESWACGDRLITCGSKFNNQTVDVNKTRCPTCAPLPFAVLTVTLNTNWYFTCGYPMTVVCSQDPIVSVPTYLYAALGTEDTAAAHGADWEQRTWGGANSTVLQGEPRRSITVILPPLATRVMSAYAVNASSFNQTQPLALGPATANSSMCTISNLAAFQMHRIPAGTRMSGYSMLCEVPAMKAWPTISLVSTNCFLDVLCAGFTGRIDANGEVVPDCIVQRSTLDNDVAVAYDRVLHLKSRDGATTDVCGADIAVNGSLTIFVEGLPVNGYFDVLVNDVNAGRCSTMVSGARCGIYFLCVTISVAASSVVRVVPSSTTGDSTCGYAARVLFALTPATLQANFTPPARNLVAANLVSALQPAYQLVRQVSPGVVNPTRALMYLAGAERVAFVVAQSGYACPTCTQPALTGEYFNEPQTTSATTPYACGGNLTFASNVSGLSGQCHQQFLCGDTAIRKIDPYSPGYVKIGGDFVRAFINGGGSSCQLLSISVWAKPTNPLVKPRSTFLIGVDSQYFRTGILDVQRSGNAEAFAALAFANGSTPLPALSPRHGVINLVGQLYDVPAWTPDTVKALSASVTLACVMDFLTSALGGYCLFHIPFGATNVVIYVENSNYVTSSHRLFVRITSSTTHLSDQIRLCGGNRGFFGFDTAENGACGSFVRCSNDTLKDTNGAYSYRDVSVYVPAAVAGLQPCAHTAVILATFTMDAPSEANIATQRQITCEQGGGMYCRANTGNADDYICVATENVCDGVRDCRHNADEADCGSYAQVEAHAIPPMGAQNATTANASSVLHCQRLAILNKSRLFAFSSGNESCVVFTNRSEVTSFIASPFLQDKEGYLLFANISSRLNYGRCTDAFTCHGNGEAQRAADGVSVIGQQCGCLCRATHGGATCSNTRAIGTSSTLAVRVLFNQSVNPPQLALRAIEIAVTTLSPDPSNPSYACQPFFVEPITLSHGVLNPFTTLCAPTVATASVPSTMTYVSVTAMNAVIGTFFSTMHVVSAFLLPSPGFQIMDNCTLAASKSATRCAFFQPQPVVSILVTATTLIEASVVLEVVAQQTVVVGGSSRRLTNVVTNDTTLRLSCTPPSGNQYDSCHAVSCVVALPANVVSVTSAVASIVQASDGTTVLAAKDMCSTPNIVYNTAPFASGGSSMPLPDQIVSHEYLDDGMKVATAVMGCVVGLLLFAALPMYHQQWLAGQDRKASIVNDEARSEMHTRLKEVVAEVSAAERSKYFFQRRRTGVLVGAVLIFLVCVLSILVWVALDPLFASNTNVLFETYADTGCDSNTLAPNPSFAVMVSEDHQSCINREAIGSGSAMVPYLAAYCDVRGDGSVVVMVRSAFTVDACRDAPFYPIAEGTCLPSGALWGSDDPSYVVARCGSPDGIAARAALLSGGTTQTLADDRTVASEVTVVPSILQNNWTQPHSSDPSLMAQVFLIRNAVFETLSSTASRTATLLFDATTGTIPKSLFGSIQLEYSLLTSYTVQLAHEVYTHMTAPWYHPASRSIDVRDELKLLTEELVAPQRALAAPQREFPVGAVFNYFNSSRQVSGTQAQGGAHHYYNIADNPNFDIGKLFNRDIIEEGGGATVTFNLLATRSSLGFAFATTDAYVTEDAVLPALDKLQDMIVNYRGPSAWFNDTLSVYFSVFVDGPSAQLVVAYANPGRAHDGTPWRDANRFVSMPFSLPTMGQERLFNGAWHRVDVVLRVRNGQPQASLMVDGVASQDPGWTTCMPHDPQLIAPVEPGAAVRTAAASHRFYAGGVLVVGAFNGGIQGLETHAEPLTVLQARLASSQAVQAHTAMDTTPFTALGAALLCIAALCVVVVFATTVRHMLQADDHERTQKELLAFLNYGTVVCSLRCDTKYRLLGCNAAMRLLGARNHDQLSAVLDEVKRLRYEEPSMMTVMALIYARTQGRVDCLPQNLMRPSADAWNTFVAEDCARQDILRAHRRCIGSIHAPSWLGETADADDIDDVYLFLATPTDGNLDADVRPDVERRAGGGGGGRMIGIANSRANTDGGTANGNGDQTTSALVNMGNDPLTSQLTDVVGAVAQVTYGLPVDSFHFVAPVIHVLQMVFLWMRVLQLPQLYLQWFHALVALLSVELVAFIPHFPPMTSVYVQLVCGIVLALLVTYFLHADWDAFRQHVLLYWSSRDRVDHVLPSSVPSSVAKMTERFASANVRNPFSPHNAATDDENAEMLSVASPGSPSPRERHGGSFLIHLLQRLSHRSHQTRRCMPHVADVQSQYDEMVGQDDANVKYVAAPSISLDPKLASRILRGGTDAVESVQLQHENGESEVVKVQLSESGSLKDTGCTNSNGRSYQLTVAGPCCPFHQQRPLGSYTQTDVFPVENAAHCCLSADGKLCGRKVGIVYQCGKTTYVRGEKVVCQYALCERHFRCGAFESVRSDFLGFVRRAQSRGMGNALGVFCMIASNALYTPFVKTALMVVARDPYYQCLLKDVRLADPRTAVVLVVGWMTLVLYGICYPCVAWLYINGRRALLRLAFFAPDYCGYYEAHPKSQGGDEGVDSAWPLHDSSSTASTATQEDATATRRLRQREWSRYVCTDPTAASYQYRALSFDWMTFNPWLLVVKAALIVPVVFAPTDSLVNRGAIAGVELCFMLLLFHSSHIFNSPLVDLMYRLGSVHQLLFLGIECFDVVSRYDTGRSRHDSVLVTLTLAYLVFCCSCFAWAVLRPPMARYHSRQKTTELLQRHGLRLANAPRTLLMTPTEPSATNMGITLSSGGDALHLPTTQPPEDNDDNGAVDIPTQPSATQPRPTNVEDRGVVGTQVVANEDILEESESSDEASSQDAQHPQEDTAAPLAPAFVHEAQSSDGATAAP